MESHSFRKLYTQNVSSLDQDIRYNDLMNEVRRGVKTDWLAQPVRNVFNQTHSMNLSGGVESIRYSVDLNYNTHNGAMKGSYRDVYGVKEPHIEKNEAPAEGKC